MTENKKILNGEEKILSDKIAPNLRALHILEVMSQSETPMTPTDVSVAIGLPKQTVHRLCATLEEHGYLRREAGQKGLRPSRRSREIGNGLIAASRSHIARHQILRDLSQQVGETVNFVIAEERGMFYQDRVETDWPFRIQLPIGTHVPFHCTASGKSFLSSLPLGQRRAMLAALPLNKLTGNTITDPDILMEELKTIRRVGYALDNEEFVDGMVAISVPVRDPRGRFHAAVAFHGPVQRLTLEAAVAQKDVILKTAEQLREAIFV